MNRNKMSLTKYVFKSHWKLLIHSLQHCKISEKINVTKKKMLKFNKKDTPPFPVTMNKEGVKFRMCHLLCPH